MAMTPPRSRKAIEWLIEIDPEGFVLREIEFDSAGRVSKITRPGEFGMWNDSQLGPRVPPFSDQAIELWESVGAIDVSRRVFEAAWLEAEQAHR